LNQITNTALSDRKIILLLAIPAVLQTLVRSSFAIIDAYWVGKLGSIQLAALTISYFFVWASISLGEMISTGTNSLVAQSVGAGNYELAKKISTVNIVNTFVHSFVLGLLIIPLIPVLFIIINITPEESVYAYDYLIPFLLGMPCVTLLATVGSIFRGYGDTKTPFYLLIVSVGLNMFLTPALIFGIKGHFVWGLKGAAIATLITYFAGFLTGFILLKKRKLIGSIFKYKFEKLISFETIKIGFPISLNGVAFSLIYIFVARFVAEYGATGLASLGIGHRSESIAYQVTVGFSLAATILVGQYMGAENPEKAERLAWKTLGLCSVFILIYAVVLFVFSYNIASFFSTDANVIQNASDYNKIAAIVLIFSAAEVVLSGAFSGAGDTVPTAVTGLPMNLLRIPLAAVFSPLMGLKGIWVAICITVIIKGIVILIWFRLGKWKTKKSKLIKPQINLMQLTDVD
jgi:putative MATE family efflux protein